MRWDGALALVAGRMNWRLAHPENPHGFSRRLFARVGSDGVVVFLVRLAVELFVQLGEFLTGTGMITEEEERLAAAAAANAAANVAALQHYGGGGAAAPGRALSFVVDPSGRGKAGSSVRSVAPGARDRSVAGWSVMGAAASGGVGRSATMAPKDREASRVGAGRSSAVAAAAAADGPTSPLPPAPRRAQSFALGAPRPSASDSFHQKRAILRNPTMRQEAALLGATVFKMDGTLQEESTHHIVRPKGLGARASSVRGQRSSVGTAGSVRGAPRASAEAQAIAGALRAARADASVVGGASMRGASASPSMRRFNASPSVRGGAGGGAPLEHKSSSDTGPGDDAKNALPDGSPPGAITIASPPRAGPAPPRVARSFTSRATLSRDATLRREGPLFSVGVPAALGGPGSPGRDASVRAAPGGARAPSLALRELGSSPSLRGGAATGASPGPPLLSASFRKVQALAEGARILRAEAAERSVRGERTAASRAASGNLGPGPLAAATTAGGGGAAAAAGPQAPKRGSSFASSLRGVPEGSVQRTATIRRPSGESGNAASAPAPPAVGDSTAATDNAAGPRPPARSPTPQVFGSSPLARKKPAASLGASLGHLAEEEDGAAPGVPHASVQARSASDRSASERRGSSDTADAAGVVLSIADRPHNKQLAALDIPEPPGGASGGGQRSSVASSDRAAASKQTASPQHIWADAGAAAGPRPLGHVARTPSRGHMLVVTARLTDCGGDEADGDLQAHSLAASGGDRPSWLRPSAAPGSIEAARAALGGRRSTGRRGIFG